MGQGIEQSRTEREKLSHRVLDEVTTHLDVQTIRALAEALKAWSGALLLITHDRYVLGYERADGRWFCNAVVNSIDEDALAPGQTYLVEGGRLRLLQGVAEYEEHMESKVQKRVGAL